MGWLRDKLDRIHGKRDLSLGDGKPEGASGESRGTVMGEKIRAKHQTLLRSGAELEQILKKPSANRE